MTGRLAGLVLAAGGGSRLGRPKALVRLADETLVQRCVRVLREGGCDPVLVVLGAASDKVRRQATLAGAETVKNPGWASGMASSLRTGLDGLEGRCDAVVVALADQPYIQSRAVERLVAAWREGAEAAVATYEGQPRNPVLLDASVWSEVRETTTGDVGARAWLRAHPGRVMFVACDGTGSPTDIDTAEDLARAKAGEM